MTLSEKEYANSADNELLQQIKSQNWDSVEQLLTTEIGRKMTRGKEICPSAALNHPRDTSPFV